MFFEDLSTYEFCLHNEQIKNIGWLQGDFKRGETSKEFKNKLETYLDHKVKQTKGFHVCEYCCNNVQNKGLSSSEIRVVGNDGAVYASPQMIYHYVVAHNYLPPQEFIDAVLTGPEPGSENWKQYLDIVEKENQRRVVKSVGDMKKCIDEMVENLSEEISKDVVKKCMDLGYKNNNTI